MSLRQRPFLRKKIETPCGGDRRKSVDACWHPLTPEHGFPSLCVLDSRRSPSARCEFHGPLSSGSAAKIRADRAIWSLPWQKNRRHQNLVPPAMIRFDDFLRRHYPHQVKGSKVTPSSQPVLTPDVCKLPCILLLGLLYTPCHKVQEEKCSPPGEQR